MASRKLQDSNRDKAGNFIGDIAVTQSCEPCMKSNISNTATVFCKDCDEFLCDACKNPHNIYKAGNHDIVKVQVKQSAPVMIDMKGMDKCHEHGREIEFLCHDHSKLCCSSCVLLHRRCNQVDEIAKVFRLQKFELQAFKQSLIQLQSESDAIIADCKQSETGLHESILMIALEVDTMRDRIIKLFEEAKQKLITEAKQFTTAEVKRIGNKRDASSRVKEELNKVLSMWSIVLERATPSQQFIYAEVMKEKKKSMASIICDQRRIKIASTVTVSFPKELNSLLEMGSNFIKLNYDGNDTAEANPNSLSSQPRPVTLELLISVDLHGDDDTLELTGVDFLPDGRLVAVDSNNKECIIMNERLQRIGTPYKFKQKPLGVVCVSHNALCVTFGEDKVVCLLSVSTDNTIRLTKEFKTSSEFGSICCMSPSQMVVSTCGTDPRPARIISMEGVESDFDHWVHPMERYKLGESKCTYVQSKNTLIVTSTLAYNVIIYDTVKGTFRKVTNMNIGISSCVCVGPGNTVLVCCRDCIVHLTVDGEQLGKYSVHMRMLHSMCVSKDGTKLAVSNSYQSPNKLQLYKISPTTVR